MDVLVWLSIEPWSLCKFICKSYNLAAGEKIQYLGGMGGEDLAQEVLVGDRFCV